jgi:2-phosphosulfolactate phosphatase
MDQAGFAYRFDWGPSGLRALAPVADVLVVVDILRFTTAVTVAVEAGATVFPYRWADEGAAEFAERHDAVLADLRSDGTASLSPTDLRAMAHGGMRVVLPSPNGSALAFAARHHGARHVLAGCFRNAPAVAQAARHLAAAPDGSTGVVALIAAGERWRNSTGPLRPAVEDLLGAGAILAALDPSASISTPGSSPEAAAARSAFLAARPLLFQTMMNCGSGRELAARGWIDDIALAAEHAVSDVVPQLAGDAFVAFDPDSTSS